MDQNAQGMDIVIRRQTQKKHLAAVWAGLAGLEPGMVVADIGCGPGVLTREYARMIGNGTVYALDASAAYAQALSDLPNVHFLFQNYDSEIQLEQTPHIVFLTDKLQHIPDPGALLAQVFAVCGPQSKILITGYDPEQPGRVGMKPRARMPAARLIGLVEAAGFMHGGVFDAPDEHYALIATRALPHKFVKRISGTSRPLVR